MSRAVSALDGADRPVCSICCDNQVWPPYIERPPYSFRLFFCLFFNRHITLQLRHSLEYSVLVVTAFTLSHVVDNLDKFVR